MGHLGRFVAVDARRYPRRSRVIVRTGRGLEVGEVLAPPADETASESPDGHLLRGMTVADELLAERLERHRHEALAACCREVDRRRLPVTLIDVEHLFDGEGLYFYFLGPIEPEVEQLTNELAAIYDAKAQIHRFAQTLAEGCGPDCGTENGGSGGCESCGACAVAVACGRGG
jgi:cell fate regulator YaaT (PSP1 superfamily)